jgi:SAM-dependent methyltransferase
MLYDKIGGAYSGGRQSDPRIAAAIEYAVAGCDSILNVGAGTGSYEPASRFVVAVEPSRTMIAQRLVGAAPVVQGCAEALPFSDCSFDAVLGILTVHHWKDQESDIASGAWEQQYRTLMGLEELDLGYRILISLRPAPLTGSPKSAPAVIDGGFPLE